MSEKTQVQYGHLPKVNTGGRRKHDHEILLRLYEENPGISCPKLCKLYEEETGSPISDGAARSAVSSKKDAPFSGGTARYSQAEVDLIAQMASEGSSMAVIATAISLKFEAGEEGFASKRSVNSVRYKKLHIMQEQSKLAAATDDSDVVVTE